MASRLRFQREWSTFTTTGFDTQSLLPIRAKVASCFKLFDSPTLKKGAGGIPRITPVIFRNLGSADAAMLAGAIVMEPAEVEFLAEKELVTITPNFSENKLCLISVCS